MTIDDNYVEFKLGHHYSSDNLDFGKGLSYEKHYHLQPYTLDRPAKGYSINEIYCPTCNEKVKIKVLSIRNAKTKLVLFRAAVVIIVLAIIWSMWENPKSVVDGMDWIYYAFAGVIITGIILDKDFSKPKIVKDIYFVFWRHKLF